MFAFRTLRHLISSALIMALAGSLLASDLDGMMEIHFPGPKKKDKKKEGKAFKEVIEKAEKIEGLFTLYRNDEKAEVWMSILPDQLDRDYILSMTQESGIGARGMLSGLPAGHGVIRFRKIGEHIHVIRRNLMFRASVDASGTTHMVERNFSDSPLGSFKVVAEPEEESGAFLVEADEFFMQDLIGVGRRLKRVLDSRYSMDKDMSWLNRLQSFPENTEIGASYAFSTESPKKGWSTLSDPRHVEIRVRYSLSEMPESSYSPRLADARVGYFQTGWRQFGDDSANDPMMRMANRWHLVKATPGTAPSEPVEPIVFWLENAIPEDYREVVREGVLSWNRAFEAAGFLNAVVVKQQPDDADWDPADIRYNTIRWISSSELSFGAMGPSQVNPYTGEILNADILIEADMVRRIGWGWRAGVSPLGAALPDPGLEKAEVSAMTDLLSPKGTEQRFPGCLSHASCANATLQMEAANMACLHLLQAGVIQADGEMPWKYIRQYLFAMVSHEVGHTLGLRHNFRGSMLHPIEDLNDPQKTAIGIVSSVMEYDPPNLALDPADQGDYYNSVVGPYDIWAIRWGYTPGSPDLIRDQQISSSIARLSIDPQLAFGTDEDAYGVNGWASAVDPECRTFDLSSDKLAWRERQLNINRALMHADPASLLRPDEDYLVYRSAFQRSFGAWWQNVDALCRYVGAIRTRREPAAVGLKPLSPYSGEEQRQALEMLVRESTDSESWEFPGAQLDQMAQGYRWSFDGSTDVKRIDFALHDLLRRNRTQLIKNLYAPRRLARVSEVSARQDAKDPLRLEEVLQAFDKAIWARAARTLDERNLQVIHLDRMIELYTNPKLKLARDVRLLAGDRLTTYGSQIKGWKAEKYRRSAVNVSHLKDMSRRISAALEMDRDKL